MGMVNLSFALSVSGTYLSRFLAWKTEEAEHTGCWTPFINAHVHGCHISRKCMGSIA